MPQLEIVDLNIPQERMPCCPLCDSPIFGGTRALIGRVQSRGYAEAAFALVHQSCTEENEDD